MTTRTFVLKMRKYFEKFFYRMFNFGLTITFLEYLFKHTESRGVNKIRHKVIVNWLEKKYRYFISGHYENANSSPQGEIPKKIWICWWDGMDMMPPIVKACYQSVLRYVNDFQVTLITKYNYANYISMPEHVMRKVNNGKMTLTHFSNIIRTLLLYKYGGLWLDATYLVTETIRLDNISFFTVRDDVNNPGRNIAKGRWQGNCFASAPNFYFFKFIYEFLFKYWGEYNCLLTHHLYDYSINLAYNSYPLVKNAFDVIPLGAKNDIIKQNLKNEFDSLVFENAIDDVIFHKLTWKYDSQTKTVDNKLTFYGYILEQYCKAE